MTKPKWVNPTRQAHLVSLFVRSRGFCIYGEPNCVIPEQQLIETHVSKIMEQALQLKRVPPDFIGNFMRMAARVKLNYFKEENEWRIISYKPVNCDEDAFKFRTTKSMLVPFYEVPINLDSIVNIMIGPCQHPDLAASSVSMLMNKYDLMDISIKNSSIPFRVF